MHGRLPALPHALGRVAKQGQRGLVRRAVFVRVGVSRHLGVGFNHFIRRRHALTYPHQDPVTLVECEVTLRNQSVCRELALDHEEAVPRLLQRPREMRDA